MSVAPKSVIGTGTIITKAQQHAAKVSVSKDFLKQMERLKGILPEQADLYLHNGLSGKLHYPRSDGAAAMTSRKISPKTSETSTKSAQR